MEYKRVKGGEKNYLSGIRWTKAEIYEVYKLYKRINGVGLHEHNPEIQKLAKKLGRTVRSTEAQSLMFRNLERDGIYSHGNMNKLTREVWMEHELENVEKTNGLEDLETDAKEILDYRNWNKLLMQYYFRESYYGQEIGCFPVSEEIFEDVTNQKYGISDFIEAIYRIIGTSNFIEKIESFYKESLPREVNGRVVRIPWPEYFGFLIFLIYAYSGDNQEGISAANVYDRLNHYGHERFQKKWKEINSSISRDILEPIWENLEDWSISFKSGSLGRFLRRDPKNPNRCYVSRIERHALFNSNQFLIIRDCLINDGYRPESILTVAEWMGFFKKHDIPNAGLIQEYISDGSPLQMAVLAFLNNNLKIYLSESRVAGEKSNYRVSPVKLSVCLESLPLWPGDEIEAIYLRASGEGLVEDEVIIEDGRVVKIEREGSKYSKRIWCNVNLEDGLLFESAKYRYVTNKRTFWLSKQYGLNEWVEVDYPSNESSFLLLLSKERASEFVKKTNVECQNYPIKEMRYVALKFNALNSDQFDEVYNLYNPYKNIEGKIELISEFVTERRTCIFREFRPKFRYIGPTCDPRIIAVDSKNKKEICTLNRLKDNGHYYELPKEFNCSGYFQIKEDDTAIKTRYNLRIGDITEQPINIYKPILKNSDGRNDSGIDENELDIYDIPACFNREFDVVLFNQWHSNLFHLFHGRPRNKGSEIISHIKGCETSGDLLLQFVSLGKSISTYDFPKLIRELDSDTSVKYSKRIMDYWRHLGYINFQDYGEQIKVNPASIFFMQTSFGLKALLTGYRNKQLIDDLTAICSELKIKIWFEYHSLYKEYLLPTKIVLYDAHSDLNKFKRLQSRLGIAFVNDIENAFNPRYVVYQLACFYTQKSVREFSENALTGPFYEDEDGRTKDHRRKRRYNLDNLSWEDTSEDINMFNHGSVVRYEGFKDKSMTHIYRCGNKSVLVEDLSLAIFASLDSNVLIKRESEVNFEYDLYVPLFLGLPFWIERGLILLNGNVPGIEKINGKPYRIYENVNRKILEIIETKLDQQIVRI